MRERPVIAIDGPAGAGKTSVARQVANELGFVLVDTGALYRGVALAAQERDISWDDEAALAGLCADLKLHFVTGPQGAPRLFIEGEDRADHIRTPEISEGASKVSAHPSVREALLGIQRALGSRGGVVLEGRDIGTVVFPDAEVKVFLTATDEERASRRKGDLESRGVEADYNELLASIRKRDRRDSTRAIAPLRPADDAVQLDTTNLTEAEVVAEVVTLARRNI